MKNKTKNRKNQDLPVPFWDPTGPFEDPTGQLENQTEPFGDPLYRTQTSVK